MKRAWRLRRRTTPSATPTPEQLADVLDDVRRLRLTLTADLSAAAGAIDEDSPSIAHDILDADRGELAELIQRNQARVAAAPIRPARRPVRRKALLALPAVPLLGVAAMTTAAALEAHEHGHAATAPQNSAVHRVDAGSTGDVATPAQTLLRLESVLSHDPKASEVLAITDQLHRQLASLAASTNSPGQLSEAQRLLDVEQQLLEEHHPPGVAGMLAAAASLAKQLVRETELVTPAVHTPSSRPTVTPTTTSTAHLGTSPQPTPTSTRHHHHHLFSPSPSSPSPTNSQMPTSPFPAPSNFSQGSL